MKVLSIAVLFVSLNLFSAPGLICREDKRMDQGALREWVLTSANSADGKYFLQSQYVSSLHSSEIEAKNWAHDLACRIDSKAELVFCQSAGGETVVQFKDKRETVLDSLKEEDKKKTTKYTEISVFENGVASKTETFNASHCQVFGGEN